jgi:hypothetical protein
MPIEFVDATAGVATSSSINLTCPTVQAGDLVIAHLGYRIGASSGTWTLPGVFSLIPDAISSSAGTSSLVLASMRATGTEGGTIYTFSTGLSDRKACALTVWRGVDNDVPFDGVTPVIGTSGPSTSHSAASITTATDGAVAIYSFAGRGFSTFSSPSDDERATASLSGTQSISCYVMSKNVPTAGPSGTGTVTTNISVFLRTITLALRPGPDVAAIAADLTGAGQMTAALQTEEPGALLATDLAGAGHMTAAMRARFERRTTPRRELLWISGLDGQQRGVIT